MKNLIKKAGSKELALMLVNQQIDDINNTLRLFSLSTGTKDHYNKKLEKLNRIKNQLS